MSEAIKAHIRNRLNALQGLNGEKTMSEILKFVLVRSDRGDGGWTLHAPASDEEIANGDSTYLVAGTAQMRAGHWSRPDPHDYLLAARRYRSLHGGNQPR